jgi:hypothetical protein
MGFPPSHVTLGYDLGTGRRFATPNSREKIIFQ